MQVSSLITSVIAFAGLAAAAGPVVGNALVTIESLSGGTPSGKPNTTVSIPLDVTYHGNPALEAVSTLYLIGTTQDLPVDAVSCTPYKAEDGTGSHGLEFTSKTPSRLSTNTVVVGSIVCKRN